ncbi:hypothetical protein KL86CLO1_11166 [uncultured Eubacteriales bacterium]|uniref:Uncharacterized protein n=1 Tax=uncultured Eubacteriales bacterium TaxID=172733 RepID=A0A212JIL6_9FIRM|nr:hypothetical protein KL86CLO1_11166 [uncultured Eubacteriales bacterium]
MLIMETDIHFYTPEEDEHSLSLDPNPKLILRPSINLGGYLTSGTIIADKSLDKLIRGQIYRVLIEMPLIFGEAYDNVKDSLVTGETFFIQNASRKIGTCRAVSFVYEEDGV